MRSTEGAGVDVRRGTPRRARPRTAGDPRVGRSLGGELARRGSSPARASSWCRRTTGARSPTRALDGSSHQPRRATGGVLVERGQPRPSGAADPEPAGRTCGIGGPGTCGPPSGARAAGSPRTPRCPSLSPNGRFLAFCSNDATLVRPDREDISGSGLYDRRHRRVRRRPADRESCGGPRRDRGREADGYSCFRASPTTATSPSTPGPPTWSVATPNEVPDVFLYDWGRRRSSG